MGDAVTRAGWTCLPFVLALSLSCGASAQQRVQHALGEFQYTVAPNGVLLVAPHGTFDTNTPQITLEAAQLLRAGALVARRFRADKVRINVNRPTEGAHLPCAQEAQTGRAQEVYGIFADLVRKAAGGVPLRLYVDIHGNAHPPSAQNLEVAAVGVSSSEARMVKDLFPTLLAELRRENPGYPELRLLMEPADRIYFGAGCSKRLGILGDPIAPRALHFEFPRSAREPDMLKGSAALVVAIASALLASR